ncbi:hypothetical protein Bca4012_072770 [Brassica carinata]
MQKQTQKNSSQPPIVLPTKRKRKFEEGNNSSMATLFSSYEQILSFLKESEAIREKGYRIVQLRLHIEAKKIGSERNGGRK